MTIGPIGWERPSVDPPVIVSMGRKISTLQDTVGCTNLVASSQGGEKEDPRNRGLGNLPVR